MGFITSDRLPLGRSPAMSYPDNSAIEALLRNSGRIIEQDVVVTGTGALVAPVLQWTHTILVKNQWAELIDVTTLNNATAVYADIYSAGETPVPLTKAAPGATISGAPLESFFVKTGNETIPYTVHLADQPRTTEPGGNRVGQPFFITAKYGADNFIRFHLTTTDNPVLFTMKVHFEYVPMNGGTLEFV